MVLKASLGSSHFDSKILFIPVRFQGHADIFSKIKHPFCIYLMDLETWPHFSLGDRVTMKTVANQFCNGPHRTEILP